MNVHRCVVSLNQYSSLLIMPCEHIDQVSNIVKGKDGNDYPREPERNKRSMEAFHTILFNAYSVFTAMLMHIFKLLFSDLSFFFFFFMNIFVLRPLHKSKYRVYIWKWSFGAMYKGIWRRQWHPTPVLLLGKSHGCRSLVGCNPWGH